MLHFAVPPTYLQKNFLLNKTAKLLQTIRIVLTLIFDQIFFMKKVLMLVVIIGLATFTAYKLLSKKETKPEEIRREGPLTISKNSDAFNTSFAKVMNDYYAMKNAFVDWDTV